MPTKPETVSQLPEVELIEREDLAVEIPGGGGDGGPSEPPDQAGPATSWLGSRSVAVVSVVVILAALAVMSRPSDVPGLDEEPTQTTAEVPDTSTTADPAGIAPEQPAQPPVTQPIPLFDDNVPEDLPGVLTGIDTAGSLITVDRTDLRPREDRLGMELVETGPRASLAIPGAVALTTGRQLTLIGNRIEVSHADRFLEPTFWLTDMAAPEAGSAVLVDHLSSGQSVTLIPLDWDGSDEGALARWMLPSNGIEVLGAWEGELVIHRAGRVWALAPDGTTTPIAEGRVLAYDGRHLVRLRCPQPDTCQLLVGAPDAPDASVVDLPPTLAELHPDAWTGSLTVSPDGRRVATSARFGALSLPVVVDLTTGEATSRSDGMNDGSPVVWSPDGEWLAFAYSDDLIVWRAADQRSWRVPVNRELVHLSWH
jgi:hypothetical protein